MKAIELSVFFGIGAAKCGLLFILSDTLRYQPLSTMIIVAALSGSSMLASMLVAVYPINNIIRCYVLSILLVIMAMVFHRPLGVLSLIAAVSAVTLTGICLEKYLQELKSPETTQSVTDLALKSSMIGELCGVIVSSGGGDVSTILITVCLICAIVFVLPSVGFTASEISAKLCVKESLEFILSKPTLPLIIFFALGGINEATLLYKLRIIDAGNLYGIFLCIKSILVISLSRFRFSVEYSGAIIAAGIVCVGASVAAPVWMMIATYPLLGWLGFLLVRERKITYINSHGDAQVNVAIINFTFSLIIVIMAFISGIFIT